MLIYPVDCILHIARIISTYRPVIDVPVNLAHQYFDLMQVIFFA
ncbi:hypothetical protein BMETH_2349_0 [methanotrophic bacterial endosymbiont of Bathymodiolus sp.]|nr:hypothetical protein BMETH_2349_0 [methanotrophic bacterial endosymbiont of Bathymodiolus sp.]